MNNCFRLWVVPSRVKDLTCPNYPPVSISLPYLSEELDLRYVHTSNSIFFAFLFIVQIVLKLSVLKLKELWCVYFCGFYCFCARDSIIWHFANSEAVKYNSFSTQSSLTVLWVEFSGMHVSPDFLCWNHRGFWAQGWDLSFWYFFVLRTVLIFLLWMALWKDSEVSSLDAFCLFLDSAGGVWRVIELTCRT